jgi:serine/threonine-protein kinase
MTLGSAGALLPGGRYRLLQLLGNGNFGEVWEAEDLHRGQIVALKFLLGTPEGVAWREATLLTALPTPHILKVNNADLIGDVPFIDTKLARGSLDRYVDGRGMEPHAAVEAIRRVLRGLSSCHSVSLLHRDVKPANIFEDLNGDILLGDFGVAELMDSAGRAPSHGDIHIRAPEGISAGVLTRVSDVYSAGVSLYTLLAGKWPFEAQTIPELASLVATGACRDIRDIAPHVSNALAKVVRKSMDLKPADRFGSAADFDDALGQLPSRINRIAPRSEHPGHLRCWEVSGNKSLSTCVVSTGSELEVQTRHASSGRAVRDFPPLTTNENGLPRKLRTEFDRLRKA